MNDREYLVSYGNSGDFGRFRPVDEASYQRGDRVVVRSPQGLELGEVLCPATPGHARYLSRTAAGELLRPISVADEQTAERAQQRARRMFEDGRRLAVELELPLEILDVEVLLDGTQAVVQHLLREDCDYRPLVSRLSREHDILVIMHNLALPQEPTAGEEESHGCGKPDCGQVNGKSGCKSCGTGGCGTCGTGAKKDEVTAYLLGLRQKMAEQPLRTALL